MLMFFVRWFLLSLACVPLVGCVYAVSLFIRRPNEKRLTWKPDPIYLSDSRSAILEGDKLTRILRGSTPTQ